MEGPLSPSGLPPLTCPQVPVAPPVGGKADVTAFKAAVPTAKAALPRLHDIVQAANADTAAVRAVSTLAASTMSCKTGRAALTVGTAALAAVTTDSPPIGGAMAPADKSVQVSLMN
jgi:hypothetical protein